MTFSSTPSLVGVSSLKAIVCFWVVVEGGGGGWAGCGGRDRVSVCVYIYMYKFSLWEGPLLRREHEMVEGATGGSTWRLQRKNGVLSCRC